jgi:hypothetical protein
MHEALEGVPALVLDCSRDVLRNQELRQDFQQKVMDYIQFMRAFRQAKAKLGGSEADGGITIGSCSSSGTGGRKGVTPVPGAPNPEQQEGLDIVQAAVRELDEEVKAVPNAPGDVRVPAGEGVGVGVSGGLEALMMAEVSQKQQQQQQQGLAVRRG